MILQRTGHEVAGEAADGESALRLFRELRPDLVLLDIIMPGKSGLEVLAEIRAIDPAAKVVMLTAVDQDEVNSQLERGGASAIINTPYTYYYFQKASNLIKYTTMRTAKEELLGRIVAGGLGKCLLRLNASTPAEWSAGPLTWADLPPGGPPLSLYRAAVRVTVGHPAPMATALLFDPDREEHISECLSLKGLEGARKPELLRGTLLEAGNILLNATINAVLRAARLTAIPSVPEYTPPGGNPCRPAAGTLPPHLLLSAPVAVSGGGRSSELEITMVLPATLTARL